MSNKLMSSAADASTSFLDGADGEGLLRAAAVQLQQQTLADETPGRTPSIFAQPKGVASSSKESTHVSKERATSSSPATSSSGSGFKAPGPLSSKPATPSSQGTSTNGTGVTSAGSGRQPPGDAPKGAQGKDQTKEFTEEDEEEALSSRRRMRSSGMGGELGGFNQMSWLRVPPPESARLRGRGGVTMSEVRQHRKADDAWIVVRGKVYDMTPYIKFHPGGADTIMKGAGRDGTSLFNKYHPWVNIDFLLEKCLVGILVPE